MKIAFIAHAIGVGGGSLSSSSTIQYLLDKGFLRPDECIIIHDVLKEKSDEKNDLYFNLKKTLKHYEAALPFSMIYRGAPSNLFVRLISPVKVVVLTAVFLFRNNAILQKENVTTVHLNSMVLWPLLLVLPKSIRRIIHIREVPSDSLGSKIAIFVIRRYATRIISIDQVSDIAFSTSGKSVVIINPFNMTESRQMRVRKKAIKAEIGIPPNAFVVSMFGVIGAEKGLDFFIDLVKSSVGVNNLVFLVLGKPSGSYGEQGIRILSKYSHVRYLGEHTDMRRFYAITDVVIRCEGYLPLGRTVWEGVFSGGLALVPVNSNEKTSAIDAYIGKYIFTYPASDIGECIVMLEKIMDQYPNTVIDSGYPSADNIAGSAEKFFEIITS